MGIKENDSLIPYCKVTLFSCFSSHEKKPFEVYESVSTDIRINYTFQRIATYGPNLDNLIVNLITFYFEYYVFLVKKKCMYLYVSLTHLLMIKMQILINSMNLP